MYVFEAQAMHECWQRGPPRAADGRISHRSDSWRAEGQSPGFYSLAFTFFEAKITHVKTG